MSELVRYAVVDGVATLAMDDGKANSTNLRIGVESMDSHAACRTYNILMGEGRKVTLALIIDTDSGDSKAA